MTKYFEINDLDHDVYIEHLHEQDGITLSNRYETDGIKLDLSKDDLMKIFLVAVEAGLIDRNEAIIELQTE